MGSAYKKIIRVCTKTFKVEILPFAADHCPKSPRTPQCTALCATYSVKFLNELNVGWLASSAITSGRTWKPDNDPVSFRSQCVNPRDKQCGSETPLRYWSLVFLNGPSVTQWEPSWKEPGLLGFPSPPKPRVLSQTGALARSCQSRVQSQYLYLEFSIAT